MADRGGARLHLPVNRAPCRKNQVRSCLPLDEDIEYVTYIINTSQHAYVSCMLPYPCGLVSMAYTQLVAAGQVAHDAWQLHPFIASCGSQYSTHSLCGYLVSYACQLYGCRWHCGDIHHNTRSVHVYHCKPDTNGTETSMYPTYSTYATEFLLHIWFCPEA